LSRRDGVTRSIIFAVEVARITVSASIRLGGSKRGSDETAAKLRLVFAEG
jgi:hypothetical protein